MFRMRPLLAVIAALSLLTIRPAEAAPVPKPAAKKPARSAHDFSAKTSDGRTVSLASYRGKVLLIVNTASRCGFTGQYEGLEALAQRYRARGFEVLAFPANDFMNQEPGTDEQIRAFCSTEYGTTFPLFSKISVKGGKAHPLYAWLTRQSSKPGDVRWNFTKFVIGPDGQVAARFDSKVEPLSAEITGAIEGLLAAR